MFWMPTMGFFFEIGSQEIYLGFGVSACDLLEIWFNELMWARRSEYQRKKLNWDLESQGEECNSFLISNSISYVGIPNLKLNVLALAPRISYGIQFDSRFGVPKWKNEMWVRTWGNHFWDSERQRETFSLRFGVPTRGIQLEIWKRSRENI